MTSISPITSLPSTDMHQHHFLGDAALDQVVNVALVKHRSPFRYPGGKTWLIPRIFQWLSKRDSVAHFVEPFCGGAIVGLTVAFENLAHHVTLIELDPQVAAVWQIILQGSLEDVTRLNHMILGFPMHRDAVMAILAQSPTTTLDRAFATIIRNRVSHGGCLAQGAGFLRNGENNKGIGSRWYPTTIVKRIQQIQTIRAKVSFVETDAIAYLTQQSGNTQTAFFIDPPYWVAGTRLYDYSELDHRQLFATAQGLAGEFLMTYDNAAEIRQLADTYGFASKLIAMRNKNHTKQRELLIGRDLSWLSE